MKLNDDTVDYGTNLYNVGEIFLKGGKETNQNLIQKCSSFYYGTRSS
jgi:hypothetical protein